MLKNEDDDSLHQFYFLVTELALQITLEDLMSKLNSWKFRSPEMMIDIFEEVG